MFKGLLSGWTSEQISGRLNEQSHNDTIMSISHESIYKYIYLTPQARLNKKLIKLLVRHKPRRIKPKKRRETGSKIINQVSIESRLKHIELRQ